MPIYMQYGSSIKGDVTSKGHESWISISSFQWGLGRAITTSQGSAENRTATGASVSEITVTKNLDPASGDLMQDMLKGSLKTDVQIDFTETKDNNVYLSFKLTNTGISGISASSGGDRPTESVSLNFTKIAITNTKKDAQGGNSPSTVTYDLGLESLLCTPTIMRSKGWGAIPARLHLAP
jgi:type VI secretion system secreted protein Hcp